MVWLSSSHHLIPFTVSFPKMCNSWHSFSHLLFIVPPYQRELRHFGPKYLVVGSCQASKIFFFLFYYKIWAFPPKKNSHQRTSILPSEIGPNPGAHGVLGWSQCATAGQGGEVAGSLGLFLGTVLSNNQGVNRDAWNAYMLACMPRGVYGLDFCESWLKIPLVPWGSIPESSRSVQVQEQVTPIVPIFNPAYPPGN